MLQLTALAKGRVERSFQTAQDRLVKLMRVEGVRTLEQDKTFLEADYLPDWEKLFTVVPASRDDAHRPLGKQHDLAAILCSVEQRVVTNDYTFRFDRRTYQIARKDIRTGLRGGHIRVERRGDGEIAARFEGKYLHVSVCTPGTPELKQAPSSKTKPSASRPTANAAGRSKWMDDFWDKPTPPTWSALKKSNATS